MDFDLENVVEMSLFVSIIVLFLKANLSIIVELTGEQQMVGWLDFKVVTLSERSDHSVKALSIFDDSTWLLSESKNVNSVFGKDKEVVGGEEESFDW